MNDVVIKYLADSIPVTNTVSKFNSDGVKGENNFFSKSRELPSTVQDVNKTM